MERVRKTACLLLPTLWVLAAEPCLAEAISGRSGNSQAVLMLVAAHGAHGPAADLVSLQQAARMLSRRMVGHMGWGGVPVPTAIASFGADEAEPASAGLAVSAAAPSPGKCWQFHWRTASRPRAPSTVS